MNVVDIRSDLRMVLDRGPGQAYLPRRGPQAVLIDTGIASRLQGLPPARLTARLLRQV